MSNFKGIAIILLALSLAACATYTWAPGPTAQGTFEEASGRCKLLASTDQSSFYAQGSPSYVAGATLGATLGEAMRQQNDFNSCMLASGWVQTGPADAATVAAQRAEGEAIVTDLKACLHAVRINPKYSSITSHLRDETNNTYTLAQLADPKIPTVREAALVSDYADESNKCVESHLEQIAKLDPRAANKLRAANAATRDAELSLVERKISWGDYARYVQAIADADREGRPPPPPLQAANDSLPSTRH